MYAPVGAIAATTKAAPIAVLAPAHSMIDNATCVSTFHTKLTFVAVMAIPQVNVSPAYPKFVYIPPDTPQVASIGRCTPVRQHKWLFAPLLRTIIVVPGWTAGVAPPEAAEMYAPGPTVIPAIWNATPRAGIKSVYAHSMMETKSCVSSSQSMSTVLSAVSTLHTTVLPGAPTAYAVAAVVLVAGHVAGAGRAPAPVVQHTRLDKLDFDIASGCPGCTVGDALLT